MCTRSTSISSSFTPFNRSTWALIKCNCQRRTPLPINISTMMKIKQSVRRRWMLRRLRNGLLAVACLSHPVGLLVRVMHYL